MPTRRAVSGALAWLVPIASFSLASLPPSTAHAQAKDGAAAKIACVQASDKAQQLRVAGKLVAATEALRACVQEACPSVVREACSQWMGEVNASIPSIVIGAKDGDGKDLLDVKVSIDGQLVTEHLEGRAFSLDPGRHRMRYEKSDGAVLEEDILVGEGIKNRPVSVAFPGTAKPAVTVVVAPSTPASTTKTSSTANTAIGTVFAVVGAGALGTALYLDLSTTSNVNALKLQPCAKNGTCSASTVNGYQLDYDLAGVGLGVGVLAVAFATYVFLAHPFGSVVTSDAAHAARITTKPSLEIVPSARGGSLALTF
jgi:hypothetical protein